MTVEKALEALKENWDQIQEVPDPFVQLPVGELVRVLMSPKTEELQQRSNQEWLELLKEEDEPLEAAKLVLDWFDDKVQAGVEQEGIWEARHDRYQSLTD